MLRSAVRDRTFSTIEPAVSTPPEVAIDRFARERLKRHFYKWHWTLIPDFLLLTGLISLISALYLPQHMWSLILLCIVLAGSGALWRYWRSLFVASQQEFDHIAEADFKGAQSLALEAFELTAPDLIEPEPCKFRNAGTKREIGQAYAGVRVGSDEKARRTPHEYLIVNFGPSHLFVFRCVWDLTSGATLWEETREFAYHDIVSVELTHKKDTIRINLKTRELLPMWKPSGIFPINGSIQVPSDESVALRLASSELVELFSWKRSSAGIPSGEGKKSFLNAQRLQKLVREYKHLPPETAVSAPGAKEAAPTIRHVRSS